VVIYLQQSGNADLTRAGRLIDAMRAMRNRADYDMTDPTVETLSSERDTAEMAWTAIEHLDEFDIDEPGRVRRPARSSDTK